jgi:ankyrin repeat protein
MPTNLPARPSLEHLKKQAKALLKDLLAGDPESIARYGHVIGAPPPEQPKLADAQFAIARQYGFGSWPRLKAHVEAGSDPDEPVDALVAAVNADDVDAVRQLLRDHPSLTRRLDDPLKGFHFGGTALLAARNRRNRALVELLLDAGANINQKSHWWAGGFGILDDAMDAGWVDWLVSRGAVMDAYAAARHGRMDVLRQLVAADPAAVRMRGGDGQTPLHVAAGVEVARFLLDHGADIDARDVDHESTAAQYLVREHPDVTRYLISRGAQTDLLMSVALGDLALVRQHLDANPRAVSTAETEEWFPKTDPRASDHIYNWVLWRNASAHAIARRLGHDEVFRELMARSPDDLRLAVAAELGDDALIREVLARRPDLGRDMPEPIARRLAQAAQDEDWPAVRVMLAAGWPVNGPGPWGASVLHWAAWHGNTEMVRELLRQGADPKARDASYGGTPYNWAQHAAREGWHPGRGDYAGTLDLLKDM